MWLSQQCADAKRTCCFVAEHCSARQDAQQEDNSALRWLEVANFHVRLLANPLSIDTLQDAPHEVNRVHGACKDLRG